MHHKMKFAITTVLLAALTLVPSCGFSKAKLYKTDGFAMDTIISQAIYSDDSAVAKNASDKASAEIKFLTISSPATARAGI